MREPKPIDGARSLIFDRLVDHEPESAIGEQRPLRILDKRELKESVRRELGRLLNTRCSLSTQLPGQEERTVLDYGIPDFSSYSPHSADDHRLIANIISQSIAAFEPRLQQVRVTVEQFRESDRALRITIEAVLVTETITEAVLFPVTINNKTGAAEVQENEGS